jgi:hypothetical protein
MKRFRNVKIAAFRQGAGNVNSAPPSFRQRSCRPCPENNRSDQSQVQAWPAPRPALGAASLGLMCATLFRVSTKHLHARISLNKNHVVKTFHTRLFSQLQ